MRGFPRSREARPAFGYKGIGKIALRRSPPGVPVLTSDRYSVGVDLGGTNLRVSAYREAGQAPSGIIDSIALPTRVSDGPAAVVADMAAAIKGLLDKYGRGTHFAGVGIGTPGPLELPEGVMRNPPNLPGFDGFPLREALAQAIGEAVTIESDANLAALAEFRLGSGKSYAVPSLCMLTLGTGVGNGIIIDGKILDGNNGMAGEAGHNTVIADGEECPCGSRGCLELYASATGVQRMAAASRTLQRQQANSPEDSTPPTAHDVAKLAYCRRRVRSDRLCPRRHRSRHRHWRAGEHPEPAAVCCWRRRVRCLGPLLSAHDGGTPHAQLRLPPDRTQRRRVTGAIAAQDPRRPRRTRLRCGYTWRLLVASDAAIAKLYR